LIYRRLIRSPDYLPRTGSLARAPAFLFVSASKPLAILADSRVFGLFQVVFIGFRDEELCHFV
jgi:hypothetical protein